LRDRPVSSSRASMLKARRIRRPRGVLQCRSEWPPPHLPQASRRTSRSPCVMGSYCFILLKKISIGTSFVFPVFSLTFGSPLL